MRIQKIGLLPITVILLATFTTTFAYDCNTVTKTGMYGTLSGGNQYGCSRKKYDISFGRTMAVKMTWTSFNDIPGDMPYCTDGYIKVYAG